MSEPTTTPGYLPPFCEAGCDGFPIGPALGSAESDALAAWEVLTGARVARCTGSGRLSLLGRYRNGEETLMPQRIVWIALHAFEGAEERWRWRLSRAGLCDDALRTAIVQEMGGPAEEPDEMTTLGFWLGPVGFHFDCRGPRIEIVRVPPDGAAALQRQRIGPAALLAVARRILHIPHAPAANALHRREGGLAAPALGSGPPPPVQLPLL